MRDSSPSATPISRLNGCKGLLIHTCTHQTMQTHFLCPGSKQIQDIHHWDQSCPSPICCSTNATSTCRVSPLNVNLNKSELDLIVCEKIIDEMEWYRRINWKYKLSDVDSTLTISWGRTFVTPELGPKNLHCHIERIPKTTQTVIDDDWEGMQWILLNSKKTG